MKTKKTEVILNKKEQRALGALPYDHCLRCLKSPGDRHELEDVIHDSEAMLGLEQERSVAHALAVLVLSPYCYRLAIGTEKWFTRFKVDAQSALAGSLLTIPIEWIREYPDSPQRLKAHVRERGTDIPARFHELIREVYDEFATGEEEARHMVRLYATGIFGTLLIK